MKPNKFKHLVVTVIGVLLIGSIGGYLLWGRHAASEEYITAKVVRGAIRNTVSATGTLQAVTTVQVGTQVSGTISDLYADFNTIVKKGQVVAKLDPRVYEAQVASTRASLAQAVATVTDANAKLLAAQATVDNLRDGVSSADANLAALKATRDDAKSFLNREQLLVKDGLINERDFDTARTNYSAAEARFKQAGAQLDQARVSERMSAGAGLEQAKAAVEVAKAQVNQIQASLEMAEVNLSYTTITSPIDGVVVARSVDKGQTVAASLAAPTLFTIANDLTQMQVIANIDQADIGMINKTNRVTFTVDAFPGQNFTGTINQIRLSPQNVQNVITYNVVIDVRNPELKLKPGMTSNLTLIIAERKDTLKISNAALLFHPEGVTNEQLREMTRSSDTRVQSSATPDEGKDAAQAANLDSAKRQSKGNRSGSQNGGSAMGQNQPGKRPDATLPVPSTNPFQEGQTRIVWTLGPDNTPKARKIKVGITDNTMTEVIGDDLKEGDTIIISQIITADERPKHQQPPGFGGGSRPGGGRR